jgi:adenine-specific DNA methylase
MSVVKCPGCGLTTNTVWLDDSPPSKAKYCYLYADDDGTWKRGCIPRDAKIQNPYFVYNAKLSLGKKWRLKDGDGS